MISFKWPCSGSAGGRGHSRPRFCGSGRVEVLDEGLKSFGFELRFPPTNGSMRGPNRHETLVKDPSARSCPRVGESWIRDKFRPPSFRGGQSGSRGSVQWMLQLRRNKGSRLAQPQQFISPTSASGPTISCRETIETLHLRRRASVKRNLPDTR